MNYQSDPHLHERENHRRVLGKECGMSSVYQEVQTDEWVEVKPRRTKRGKNAKSFDEN